MVKTNIEYLKNSIANPESLDIRYMSLELHESLDEMVEVTKEIKELLITIKRLNMNNLPSDQFYEELKPLVLSELGSKNEFNGFINACDSAISTIHANPETFKQIVDLYLEHRDISEHTPKEWIQAVIDKGSQRSLGVIGERKVIEIAISKGFTHVSSLADFYSNDYSVIFHSKEFQESLPQEIDFGSQAKLLDIVIKAKDKLLFLEAKHIKEAGGAQDKQIKELIGLLNVSLPQNVNIISFMDGVYSNHLLALSDEQILNPNILLSGNRITKINKQRQELLTALQNNEDSFWVNTSGLESLLEDLMTI